MRQMYQVWHEHNWPMCRVLHGRGHRPLPAFPEDYTHVANVMAESMEQVCELIRDKGTLADGPEHWQCWEENPGVNLLAETKRSTSAADVVIDPHGQRHCVGAEGFDYRGMLASGDYFFSDVLAAMAMARARKQSLTERLWNVIRKAYGF